MQLPRRFFQKLSAIGLLALGMSSVHAQDTEPYPNRPITVVVPLGPGGSGDVMTRYVMDRAAKLLGQPVVVSNKPGGNLVIGARALLSAPADGYTFLSTINAQITGKVLTTVPYDPFKDFTPVAKMATGYFVFVVSPKLPVNTFAEFVEYAKRNPVTHGAFAPTSLANVFAETINVKLGTRITTAMYKGGAAVVNDLLGGSLDACFCSSSEVMQHVKAGKIKVLAYSGPVRNAAYPEVPTFAEQGFKGSPYDYGAWVGVIAQTGVPPERIKKFAAAIQTVLQQEEVKDFMHASGATVEYENPATFGSFLTKSYAAWEADVRSAKIEIK